MGCKTQFCIGGACEASNVSVQDWVQAFGYVYDANDPLATYYPVILKNYPQDKNAIVWPVLAEACMRTRSMLFCNSTPGDVGGVGNGSPMPLVAIGKVGVQAAGAVEAIAGVVGSLGAATAGIGALLGPILAAFQAHAAAVSKQANALNSIAPAATQAIRQADAYVQSGQVTAAQGVSMIRAMAVSMAQQDASLTKSCNAFCGYNAILSAIADVSVYFYQLPAAYQTLTIATQGLPSNIIQSSTNITSGMLTPVANMPLPLIAPSSLSAISPVIWILLAVVAAFLLFRGGV